MISEINVNLVSGDGVSRYYFFVKNNNETITRFGFFDILDNQDLFKCYQPIPSAWLITLTFLPRPHDYSGYHKNLIQ